MDNKVGREVYIVAAKRTPICSFVGKLSKLSATDLGAVAIRGALESIKLAPNEVDEVILGNVVSAGLGQAPARQAALKAGLPVSVTCTTINKVCSSGMKSVIFGAQSIQLGQSDVVVAGGFESMSNGPFYVQGHRKGHSFGDQKLIDSVSHDGLTDPFKNIAMGLCAQKTVSDFKMTRDQQDQFAQRSYDRTINSIKSGKFTNEIVPVDIGNGQLISQDDQYKRYQKNKVSTLKPAFKQGGTITAANSSKLNDGACAIILMSQDKIKKLNIRPLARIVSYADAQLEPIDFCIAPELASKKALKRANLSIKDIDFFEFNEAFSATVLSIIKMMELPHEKVNVNGGAVSLGHPIGMSGARIIQSLISVLQQNGGKYGLAAICNGGGGASSIILQLIK